jgi:hypothetical protein
LAKLPPCPPFPEFTDFEKKALHSIGAQFGAAEAAFRDQVAAAEVADRINTVVGFYTRVVVDRSRCEPLVVQFKGGQFDVEGVEFGVGVILWGEAGYLDQIEGFTYADDTLKHVDLADLKFLTFVQPG